MCPKYKSDSTAQPAGSREIVMSETAVCKSATLNDGKRDWKANPPKTKEEGLQCIVDLHIAAMERANRNHGFGGRVERRGNIIAHIYPDGHEDLFEMEAEMIQ